MQRLNTTLFLVLVGAMIAMLALATSRTDAHPQGQIVVATIDLEAVINNLDELPAREQALQTFINEKQSELQVKADAFEQAQAQLQAAVPGSSNYEALQIRAQRLALDAELEKQFSEQLIAQRRAQTFAELFEKINQSVQELALQRGYDIVLNSDENMITPQGNEQQVRSFMISRRVLYSADSVDISQELLTKMNNEWAAGK
ncbi:MAG: OmpH family outer membrane protein [Phycisphaerales bacterium JB043]